MSLRTLLAEPQTRTAAARRNGDGSPATSPARADIQGLRAVAVLLVVLNHLGAWPRGGFIGVDVFFVISGFLITGLLLREHKDENHSMIVDFYRRRIKRIVPAALLVLGVTVIASSIISAYGRAEQTAGDALWSAIFWANWHLASIGTDYFQQSQAPSPLQHYWSLSVEEQFYIAWPLIIVAAGAAGVRLLGRERRSAITVTIAVVTAATFVWSMHESANAPTTAYFSTFSRAWELGAGALLACLAGYLPKLTTTVRCLLSTTGLAVIVLAAATLSTTSRFPAPWALAPVVGAVLVIAAGTRATSFEFTPVLSNPVSRYLGDMSYSVYLWHLPVIILLGEVIRPSGSGYYALAAGLILVLSILSYHLVENPVRTSSWLDGSSVRAWRPRQRRIDGWAQAVGATIIVVALTAALATVLRNPPVADAGSIPPLPAQSTAPGTIAALPPAVTAANLEAALAAPSWPSMDLSADALRKLLPAALTPDCFNGYPNIDKQCTFGATIPTRTAVIFGDSLAMSFEPMIAAALPSWRIVTFGKSSCPWADALVISPTSSAYTSCLDFHKKVAREIIALHPSAIFVSNSANSIAMLTSKAKGAEAQTEWTSAQQATLRELTPARAPVYVLSPTPDGADIATCATRFNKPRDCNLGGPDANWLALQSATLNAVTGMPQVKVIDTTSWVCVRNECPALYLGKPIRTDGLHLTGEFATSLAANFLAAARAADPHLFASR